MKHPALLALVAGLIVLLAAFAAPLWQMCCGAGAAPAGTSGLPWQAHARGDGTLAAFGLALGRDTLADAQTLLGDHLTVALVARLGEVGALEALADPFAAGFVTGRLVLAFDVPAADLRRWRDSAPRSQVMTDGLRRFELPAADRAAARAAVRTSRPPRPRPRRRARGRCAAPPSRRSPTWGCRP